jgi:hypothetical protein
MSSPVGWKGWPARSRWGAAWGRGLTRSSIVIFVARARRRQPGSEEAPGPGGGSTQQQPSSGSISSSEAEGSGRVGELQRAVEQELGCRLAHVPLAWARSLQGVLGSTLGAGCAS